MRNVRFKEYGRLHKLAMQKLSTLDESNSDYFKNGWGYHKYWKIGEKQENKMGDGPIRHEVYIM